MAVSSIYSGYGGLDLASILSEAKEESNSILNSSTTLASSNSWLESMQSKKAQNAYGGGASSSLGQAALQRALSEINSGGKVTFSDIAEHRANLESQFSAAVRLDLNKLGVSMDTEFTLTMSAEGKIQVECDDPVAKEKIQKYLEDNPEMCEQFGYIQALSNLERARQSPLSGSSAWQDIRSAKVEMQNSVVEAFFGEALNGGMNYSSIMAQFGANIGITESASFYAGLDFTV